MMHVWFLIWVCWNVDKCADYNHLARYATQDQCLEAAAHNDKTDAAFCVEGYTKKDE